MRVVSRSRNMFKEKLINRKGWQSAEFQVKFVFLQKFADKKRINPPISMFRRLCHSTNYKIAGQMKKNSYKINNSNPLFKFCVHKLGKILTDFWIGILIVIPINRADKDLSIVFELNLIISNLQIWANAIDEKILYLQL